MLHTSQTDKKPEHAAPAASAAKAPAVLVHPPVAGPEVALSNQAKLRTLQPGGPRGDVLQRKCACGGTLGPGPKPGPEGECAECQAKRESQLQRQAEGNAEPATAPPEPLGPGRARSTKIAPPIVHDVLRSPGQPLDPGIRAFMEPRFGCDFSGVRVHTGAKAIESARAVRAEAFTVGTDIVLARNTFSPQPEREQRLLSHELAHVVQGYQNRVKSEAAPGLQIGEPASPLEQEAEAVSRRVVAGVPTGLKQQPAAQMNGSVSSGVSLLRQPTEEGSPETTEEGSTMEAGFEETSATPMGGFSGSFRITIRLPKTRRFSVSSGSVTVTSSARWDRPASCPARGYSMTLHEVGTFLDTDHGSRSFPIPGSASRTWSGLPAGEYFLEIFVGNTNPSCILLGDITVST